MQTFISPIFKKGERCGIVHTFVNNLLTLLQRLDVGLSIGHIDCSSTTCADDVSLLGSSMKAMTAQRLPRPICRASKPIFLDQKQVYFSIFALGFAYYILAVASKKERYFIQKGCFY